MSGKLFGFSKLALFLIVVCTAAWFAFQQTVQTQIRDKVQAKISEKLLGTGLHAKVAQARFLEGQGIQLNDLVVSLAQHGTTATTTPTSNLQIYEAMLHVPATMVELVGSEPKIEAVELRRAKLTLVRDTNGEWDFQPIIESLLKLKLDNDAPIPVSLTDCEVRVLDRSNPTAKPIALSQVNVFVQPIIYEGRPLLQIQGGFQSTAISLIEFTTFLDQQTQTWQAKLSANEAKLSADLISTLPPSVQAEFAGLESLSGKINLSASATGNMSLGDLPTFEVTGNVERVSIDDQRLPVPIGEVSGTFSISNDGVLIENVAGKLGQGRFAFNYWQRGLLEKQQWHCDGFVNDFNFDDSPRLRRWLPEYSKKFCHQYSPAGTSNIRFDLTHDGTTLKRDIYGEITDMAFSFIHMPYLVENCRGIVHWKDDLCKFEVQSLAGKQVIRIDGYAKDIGKATTFQTNISVPGDLAIDEKMLEAADAQPKLAAVIRAFNPTGRVGGTGTVEKLDPNGEVLKTFDIRLKQCSIRHKNFDYPIHNIKGLVHVENYNYTFSRLSGNNSSGTVDCDGTWNPNDGLDVRFLCKSIPLNDQLRFALRPEIREIWDGFRPRGTLDNMTVDMTLPIDAAEVDVVVDARMNKADDAARANYISIHPVWFPYEMNHVTGRVQIGKGQIRLTDVEGHHQRTWMVCQGEGDYSDATWSVKLNNLLVGSLKIDEELLFAVPTELAPPIRQLEYEGLVNVHGEITIAGTNAIQPNTQLAAYTAPASPTGQTRFANRIPVSTFREQTTTMAWNLKLVMNQAKMLLGLPVENVFGSVQLVGHYDGQNAECRGDLNIDSMTVYENQVTQIRGPIWMDNSRRGAGSYARPFQNQSVGNFSPVGISPSPPNSITGKLHGGQVMFNAQMDSGPKGEFLVEGKLEDGCLKTACREFGAHLDHVEGHSFAKIHLTGDCTGTHSHRGKGIIELRGAEIYELPVFLALLKILKIGQVTRTAFDSANIVYAIEGDNIVFDRMEFLGDAISLIGNGKMNLDWEIDLNFYSVMGRGRFYIPLISEIYRTSSQKVLWIKVFGTLDNPQSRREWLPELSDSLRQLIQPRERPAMANRRGILSRAPSASQLSPVVNQVRNSTNQAPASDNQEPPLSLELPDFSNTIDR